ncbi:MAG: hypothetical protein ABFS23_05065 [Pseudomonadota bacterium]
MHKALTLAMFAGLPAAPGELHTRLADQHALSHDHGGADDSPELRDPCELADSLYAPARLYQQGLPLTTWSARMVRELVDYQQAVPLGDSLLRLPEGFGRLVISAPAEADQ